VKTIVRQVTLSVRCSPRDSMWSGSTSETSRGLSIPNSSFGVHRSEVHSACRVVTFTCAGCLPIRAETAWRNSSSPARLFRSSRSSVATQTSGRRTVNRHGYEYLHFFCRNKRGGICPSPHVQVYQVEEAIERHYASIRSRPEFITDVGAHIDFVINE
jgi:hypothetical protein